MWQRHAFRLHSLKHKVDGARGCLQMSGLMHPYIIGVSGLSPKIKNNFCSRLIDSIGKEKVLYLKQEYYSKVSLHSLNKKEVRSKDSANSVDYSLLTYHLDELTLGKSVSLPAYSNNQFRSLEQGVLIPKPIVLVEGLFLYSNIELERRFNHKIYIFDKDKKNEENRVDIDPEDLKLEDYLKSKADQVVSNTDSFEVVVAEISLKLLKEVYAN